MWKCEVIDVLTALNLEDSLHLKEKPEDTSEKYWDKMNWTVYGVIRSCLASSGLF